MKTLLLLLFVFGIYACAPTEEPIPEKSAPPPFSDSSITRVDSLLITEVALPTVINYLQFDTTTIAIFQNLATETKGEMYLAANALSVVENNIEVLETHGDDNIDLCFLIDKTGSMMDDIYIIQSSMDRIFAAIKAYKNVNVALAYYGDKNEDGKLWLEINSFSQDFDRLAKKFKTVRYSGGGDAPESVTDGAYAVINELNWTSTNKRVILLIGDAPSLVPPLASYSVQDVIDAANTKEILMNYYPIVVGFAGEKPGPAKENLIASVYPNPSAGLFNILFEKEQEYTLEVFSSSGALVYQRKVANKKHQIDLSGSKEDLYVLRVLTKNNEQVDQRKILIRK
ncbi:MAG: T9SS type A sorting domain-containing protein [Salibacteraceae bacterium]